MTKNIGVQSRETRFIKRKVTQSIFRAFDFAKAVDAPLNTYVVIHLHESPSASATTIFERIRHKFRDWHAYQTKKTDGASQPPLYVYTIENPNGAVHVNWAIHVPKALQLEFEMKLHRWVDRVQGCNGHRDTHCQPITPTHDKRLAKYIVKGTDPAFVGHFFLTDVHSPQGTVWGKRAGASPALDKAARAKAGFKPRRGQYKMIVHAGRAGLAPARLPHSLGTQGG